MTVAVIVVPNRVQETPVMIGRSFTEQPDVIVHKDDCTLKFSRRESAAKQNPDYDLTPNMTKIALKVHKTITVPANHLTHIPVDAAEYQGSLAIDASFRAKPGEETCTPAVVIQIKEGVTPVVPVINLSETNVTFKAGQIVARGWPCHEELSVEKVLRMTHKPEVDTEFPGKDLNVGPVTSRERTQLIDLLCEYRDCFALSTQELGTARSAQMQISLSNEQPFVYRPYRMAKPEQDTVRDIIADLLAADIVRDSTSAFASPVLLVKKKNGEPRLCIDYRKLNSVTAKENYPIPRIDDQMDRLQGGIYFTSLDLRSGYYQIPIQEESRQYTAFVTPAGQYEFNRMPFGLTNAPRVFQKFMSRILKPVDEVAAVYLDDVLLHATSVEESLENLRRVLEIFREQGLTLNLTKCSFLMTAVSFLGFEVEGGKVRPGKEKIRAVRDFETPKSVHNIRQFLGLTGYFRHFVKDYGILAIPLTKLLKKTVPWEWTEKQSKAFQNLKAALVERPVLALFNPDTVTEVHTDASKLGLAGILLQLQPDQKLHPVAYYSRHTNSAEENYHSYELETLAVVESLKKFRVYLLGMSFTVVTDCNALKTTSNKKQLIPRIARWWLQLQEYTFEVKYRPGERMKHVDALSRNPPPNETILRIEQADWVLSGQLTDQKVREIHEVLKRPPTTELEHQVYKNYALREGRIYRITVKGLLWVVPHGMRNQIVKASHDELGHFGTEKTLQRLCQNYWFPRMRQYVERYIACCIPCLYTKRNSGRKEGFLHPIKKVSIPLHTFHVDHLGPFPKCRRGNLRLIVGTDAFTKFSFLRAVKSTKTRYVINYFMDIFATYGSPQRIITDLGSSFTSNSFKQFCSTNRIQHVEIAVATPRANGQVERINRSVLTALLASTLEEDCWDEKVREVQFSLNNVVNKSTGQTPSQMMFGYNPSHGSDAPLLDEVREVSCAIEARAAAREEAVEKIEKAKESQKKHFDKRRKAPRSYKEGDTVLIEKQAPATGTSKKLTAIYSGPMIVQRVLSNDRYRVSDMEHSHRTRRKANYCQTVAVDKMRPWHPTGGVSDDTDAESGDDGVPLSEEEEELTGAPEGKASRARQT